MLFENTIFGPIKSRRLGNSLGVNLLPTQHKYCSYDCVYCECGWNRDSEQGLMQYATPDEVRHLLESKLQTLYMQGAVVDSITFAGNGEPTLYPHFPTIVDLVIEMRDKYYPNAVTTLLTNATQLVHPDIYDAVHKLDNPVLKLDCGTEPMWRLINRNNEMGCSFDELLANLRRFGSHAIVQTLLFDGVVDGEKVSNITDEEFETYLKHLSEIRPNFVMLYALDRETPAKELRKLPVEELNFYAEKIRNEGIEVKVYG